ncbi:MAG: GTPase HflX [Alphaproteobacteria bacterium]|nr:GTPase HflX [Alphaproteobacteria bacterium]
MKLSFVEFNKNIATKTAVVFPDVYGQGVSLSAEARLREAIGLAIAIDLDVVYKEIVNVRNVKPATLIGQGVIDRLKDVIELQNVELIVFDTSLTPIQQRNLEKKLQVKVIDRTALILEIFGERAKTKEGKMQVELAHLTYQCSRLVRSWTHLERQRGGAGFLGGPGETQIELDRRIIDEKILKIKQNLEKVKQTRQIQRSARKRVPYASVAFVGYTNAGKSTLFNKLSNSNVFAKDLLFATLDPSMRKIKLPSGREVILSDTVGFISDLPHELVMSFRATLEEVMSADLIVHIRDIASENSREQRKDVLTVLEDLGFNDFENSPRYIEVFNKIDELSEDKKKDILINLKPGKIAVSAITGENCDKLLSLIDDKLSINSEITDIKVSVADGKKISWIYRNCEVLSSETNNDLIFFKLKISSSDKKRLENML